MTKWSLNTWVFMQRSSLLIIMSILVTQSIFAKVAMQTPVPIGKVISTFETLEKTKKIKESQKKTLILVRIGRDALGLESIPVYGADPDEQVLRRMEPQGVSRSLTDAITRRQSWNDKMSAAAKADIASHRVLLAEVFGESSYSFAWFRYQLGEKSEAKNMLSQLYDDEYKSVMKLETAVYGLRGTPLGNAEDYLKALETMSDEAARKKLQKKMQKMKIHVSNLPQSHIKT